MSVRLTDDSSEPRLRIAHVLPALTKGGAERVAVELIRHAVADGHDVTCIVGWDTPPPGVRDLMPDEMRLLFVEPRPSAVPLRYARATAWLLRHRALLREVDVLHCHLTYGAFVGLQTALLRDIAGEQRPAIVESYHAVGMGITALQRASHRVLAARRDALVLMADDASWSEFARRRPRLITRTIPNGVSDPDVAAVGPAERVAYRRSVGIPDDCTHVVGTVGMLRTDRKPWRWIPVFAEIARQFGSDVHFLLAGGGPERERLEALVTERGLAGRVHITGVVDEVRLPLSVIDLYVTVNVGSATGVAAMEAALGGLPIVALQFTDTSDSPPDAWIWSSPDEMRVAARAVDLLRNDEPRRSLARAQQAYARSRHTVRAMATAYDDVYRAAIEARGRDT